MQKKLQLFFFKNFKILGLIFLIIFTITTATISNYQKELDKNQYNKIDIFFIVDCVVKVMNYSFNLKQLKTFSMVFCNTIF